MEKKLIAVIGAGGKTTALELLARESRAKSVLLTTTTHIFPMGRALTGPTAGELAAALNRGGILCAGASAPMGKLGILPKDVLAAGIDAADLTSYEADGAKYRALKLHRPGEPVILPGTTHVLVVAGLSALGKPIGEAIHRYDRAPDWQKNPASPVGVAELVRCTLETAESAGVPYEKISVLLNQADVLDAPAPAEEAVQLLKARGLRARWGSLQQDAPFLYEFVTGAGCP